MGTDGITNMDSILNVNEMKDDRQQSDATSLLRRRRAEEEKKKKVLVDKVEFNGYYYYYYSDFTKSPTIGPSMSPSMSPTDKKVLPIQQALAPEPKVSRAQLNHHFGTPYSATAVICAGCLFIVLSLGFFAYAKNPSKGDEVVSKTIGRISKVKPNRGGKSDGKGKKRGQGGAAATAEAEETGSETYLCEDEENRTLSDHNSTCAADSEIGREEVAEFTTEDSVNMPLSPLFLGHDDNNPTSTRSGLSPPSHLGLLTSEQFVDETIPPPSSDDYENSTSRSSTSSPRLILTYMSAKFEDSGKFIRSQMESLQRSMSPKNVEKSDPETVDIEICETPKNTTEKEIADDTSANIAASVASMGMSVVSGKQEDGKQEDFKEEDQKVTPNRSNRLKSFVANNSKRSGGKLFRSKRAKDNADGASVNTNDDDFTVSNVGCSAGSVASLGISVAPSKQEEDKCTPNRSNKMMSFVSNNNLRSGGKFFKNKLTSSKGKIDPDEIDVNEVDMMLEANMPKQRKHENFNFEKTVREVDFSVATDLLPEEEPTKQGVTEIYSNVYSEDEDHDETISTSVVSQDGSESVVTLLDKCSTPEENESMRKSTAVSSTVDSTTLVNNEKDEDKLTPKVEGEINNETIGTNQVTEDSLSADSSKPSVVDEEKTLTSVVGEESITEESVPVTPENTGSSEEEVTKSAVEELSPNDNIIVSEIAEQTADPSSEVQEEVVLQISSERLGENVEEEKNVIPLTQDSALNVENTSTIAPVETPSKDDVKEEETLKSISEKSELKNDSVSEPSIVDKVDSTSEKEINNHTDNIIDLDQQNHQQPEEGNINSHVSSEIKSNLTIRIEEDDKVKAEPSPTSIIPDIFTGEFKEDEKIA